MLDINEQFAPIPFLILKFCGLWRPLRCSTWKTILYNSYTILILVILNGIMISVLIAVCNMPITDEFYAENVFLMFALINAVCKAVNILISRERFVQMTIMLYHERWQKLESTEENDIQEKYRKTIRKISTYFTSAVFIAIIVRIAAPLLETNEELQLPVKSFCPCNIQNSRCYWSIYWFQAIGTGVATLTHAAKDCLISALLLQTCFQLDILSYRLLNITKLSGNAKNENKSFHRIQSEEKILISECVRDHENIFKFAKILNESLNVMLFGQLAVTIPNLCLSIYLLSKQNIASMEFMMTSQFFSAVVIELFFFCWYGNEVTLSSVNVENAINKMDWTKLSIISKKDLLIIMKRCSKPILFSVGPIMNMNIQSFLSIMKMSYSAFSVLQSSDIKN